VVAFAAAVVAGLVMTPQYRVQTTVAPVTDDPVRGGGLAELARGLGGLASMAGIGLGAGNNKDEAVEYLRGKAFTIEFIRREGLLTALHPDEWDEASGDWRVPEDDRPTIGDAYEFFSEDVLSIAEDKKTGMLKVSVTWSDPELAAEWANNLVAFANLRLREMAIDEANRSIAYLNDQAGRTSVVTLKEAIGRLTEEQVKTVMLARVRDEYAFKVIDPALAPEPDEIVRPRRALMAALGLIGGFMLGCLIALAFGSHGARGSPPN
jgi:hypothetical protein